MAAAFANAPARQQNRKGKSPPPRPLTVLYVRGKDRLLALDLRTPD